MSDEHELIEAAQALIDASEGEPDAVLGRALELLGLQLEEARGEYYYEEVEMKRWILGDGGREGNCEICIENEDMGWIDMDGVFLSSDGTDIDEAPAHPHCTCGTEFSTRRHRVYI